MPKNKSANRNTGDDYFQWLVKRGLLSNELDGTPQTVLDSPDAPPGSYRVEIVANLREQAADKWLEDFCNGYPPRCPTSGVWDAAELGIKTADNKDMRRSRLIGTNQDVTIGERAAARARFDAALGSIPGDCWRACYRAVILRVKPHPEGASAQLRAQYLERLRIGLSQLAQHYRVEYPGHGIDEGS